jgi:hypothetical protein
MSMSNHFIISPLAAETFRPLIALDDDALAARGIRRVIADQKPGVPCRVSLEDAEPGERVLLIPFTHHDVDSPYRGAGPIYVREAAVTAAPGVDEVPALLRTRLLSVRAYDREAMMVESDVVEGQALGGLIARMFANPDIAYLHVHNAKPGCFSCRVDRS